MPSTASPRLRFERQNTGENENTWGQKLNDSGLTLIDDAVAGVTTKVVSGSASLSSANYATDEARRAVLRTTGTGGTLTIPAVEKPYFVDNACSGSLTITCGGTATTLLPGERVFLFCDGSSVSRAMHIDQLGQRLRNLGAPVDAGDAATRSFVLDQIAASALSVWAVLSAPATLTPGARILADTSGGTFSLALPAPDTGREVTVLDAKGTWAASPLTLTAIGYSFANTGDASLVCDVAGARVTCAWTGATWAVGG